MTTAKSDQPHRRASVDPLMIMTSVVPITWTILLLLLLHATRSQGQLTPPFIPTNGRVFNVMENATVGSVIFTLNVTKNEPGSTVSVSVSSDFLSVGAGRQSHPFWYFNVTLTSPLDCDYYPSVRRIPFTLADGTNSIPVQIIIYIIDVNDNPPNFVKLPYRTSVREDAAVHSTVYHVTATDPDQGDGGRVVYNLSIDYADNKTFTVGADGNIVVSNRLDYESLSFFHYLVTAHDLGNPTCPGASCQCDRNLTTCDPAPVDLFITIIDVQDTPPVFYRLPYIASVFENEPLGSPILQVSAVDGDRGVKEPNHIKYSLTGGDSSPFDIDNDSGIISAKTLLDADAVDVRNRGGLYVFNVTATEVFQNGSSDPSNVHNSSTTQVSVTVKDLNDNDPKFSAHSYLASVQENTPRGIPISLVDIIEVTDADQGTNSIFQIHLEKDGAAYYDFETLPGEHTLIPGKSTVTIRVVNSSVLDYETLQNITFQIIATENKTDLNTQVSAQATVILSIEDVNDNSPEFPPQKTSFAVSEDAPINHTVAQFLATDADSGDFGEVRFNLDDGDFDGAFTISDTGLLRVAQELDRETRAFYSLSVIASDSPLAPEDQRRKRTLRVQVNVTDVNDNAPVWTQYIQYLTVQESAVPGTRITTLRAVDADEGLNGQVEYSILPGTNGSDLFSVTTQGGLAILSIRQSLIDNVGLRLVTVVAEDKGVPPLNSSIDISVDVIDENQHAPVFVRPDEASFNSTSGKIPEISVEEEQPLNSVLYQLSASDKDIGLNGEVMYFLDAMTNRDYEYFLVSRLNGTLESVRRLDRESKEIYEIQVRAQDNGRPAPLSKTLVMRVRLEDINDNLPTYKHVSQPQVLSVVEEDSSAFVGHILAALDLDLYPNNVTCYYLYGGDHLWGLRLDKESRNLSLSERLDREVTSQLNVVVKATEDCSHWNGSFPSEKNSSGLIPGSSPRAGPPPSFNVSDDSLLWVQVAVIDINDNPPQFVSRNFSASTVYDVDVGTQIMSLADSITDRDTPAHSRNKFRLKSTSTHFEAGDRVDTSKEPFVVTTNGSVRTNVRFQSDLLGYFLLTVMAYDDDGMNVTAYVKVLLVSSSDRLLLVFEKLPNQVEQIKNSFVRQLSDILNLDVAIDKIQTHIKVDGTPDSTRTDAYLHARYRTTGKIVPALELRQLLDLSSAVRSLLLSSGVVETKTLAQEQTKDESEELRKFFIIAACILAVIVITLLVVLIHMVRMYRRRLRAATTTAFAPATEKQSLDHPSTNRYISAQNPLFGKDIKHVIDQPEDTVSQNSLDVNVVKGLPPGSKSPGEVAEEQEVNMHITDDQDPAAITDISLAHLDQLLQVYDTEVNRSHEDVRNHWSSSSPGDKHLGQDGGHDPDLYDEIYHTEGSRFDVQHSHVEHTDI